MDIMLMLLTTVYLVNQDVAFVQAKLTVLRVWLCLLQMEMEAAAALLKLTSPFQWTELDIAQIVDHIVLFVSILPLVLLVLLAILKQLIINVFAQLETLLTLEEIVFLVVQDVVLAVQLLIVLNA
jgi:hypothetical protein